MSNEINRPSDPSNLWEVAKAAKRAYERHVTYDERGKKIAEDKAQEAEWRRLDDILAAAKMHDLRSASIDSDPLFGPWKDNRDGHVHNWQTYITDEVKAVWDRLGDDGKFALYLVAKKAADSEEWD